MEILAHHQLETKSSHPKRCASSWVGAQTDHCRPSLLSSFVGVKSRRIRQPKSPPSSSVGALIS